MPARGGLVAFISDCHLNKSEKRISLARHVRRQLMALAMKTGIAESSKTDEARHQFNWRRCRIGQDRAGPLQYFRSVLFLLGLVSLLWRAQYNCKGVQRW